MRKKKLDLKLILPILFLAGFSLSIIFSVSPSLFSSQFLFFFLGFTIFFLLIFFNWQGFFEAFAIPVYFLSLLFLGFSFLGPLIRGSHRWISVFGVNLQPSELLKPFFIACFARFLSLFQPKKKPRNFFINLFLLLVPVFFIFKQPDLGNALLYSVVWFAMVLTLGLRPFFIFSFFSFLFLSGPPFWHFLKEYQRLRILSFLNPQRYSQTAGYHSVQAQIAVGSGQFWGKGLGHGTQSHLQFLPEYHTDFIFASLCEELGFLGGAVVLGVYFVLLIQILKKASGAKDLFSYLFSIGVFVQLLVQVFVNVGMNLGLVPITGVTLPLLSYGGSSIISTFVSLGLVVSFKKKEKPEIFVLR